MLQGSFRGLLGAFPRCLEKVSIGFQNCFKGGSKKCRRTFMQYSRGFQEGLKEVTRVFHENSKSVSSIFYIFPGFLKIILLLSGYMVFQERKFHESLVDYARKFQWHFKLLSMSFKGGMRLKEVSRKCLLCRCFMVHVTDHSYPSRSRAGQIIRTFFSLFLIFC